MKNLCTQRAASPSAALPAPCTPSSLPACDAAGRLSARASSARCRGLWPRHHHSFRGSFSAGSTPMFASKHAFFSIFQNQHENHLLASKVCKCRQRFAKLYKISQKFARFCNFQFSESLKKKITKCCAIFTEFCKSCRS